MLTQEERSLTVLSQSSELRWDGHRIMVSTLKNYPPPKHKCRRADSAPSAEEKPTEDLSHSNIWRGDWDKDLWEQDSLVWPS